LPPYFGCKFLCTLSYKTYFTLLIIGILEQWKTGIMPARRPVGGGSEKLLQWFIRKILLKRKLKHKKLPYKIIIPQFHHSLAQT